MVSDFVDVIRKFNENHDERGRFTFADHGSPKSPGKPVDWESKFSAVKSFSDITDLIETYMPGALDVAKGRRNRQDEFSEEIDENGQWQDITDMTNVFSREDIGLAQIYELRGYHAKPQILPHQAFEKLITEGADEYFRGFDHSSERSGTDKATEFVSGDRHFAGHGLFGSGSYAAKTKYENGQPVKGSGYSTAAEYAYGVEDGIVRFTLRKDARILPYGSSERNAFHTFAKKAVDSFYDRYDNALETAIEADPKRVLTDPDFQPSGEYERYRDAAYLVEEMCENAGLYAALRGYDAVDLDAGTGGNKGYCIVLNRGAVVVDEQRYTERMS